MSKKQLWHGRFRDRLDEAVAAYTASIDIDQRLAPYDTQGTRAHARMLSAQGILSEADRDAILQGLDRIDALLEAGERPLDAQLEDIHMNLESHLTSLAGDAGARVHTGRSRNDQVSVDMRLFCLDAARSWSQAIQEFQKSLVDRAEQLQEEIFPAWTHLQAAQPISWGHYLLALCTMFGRDQSRLVSYGVLHSVSSLGAGALAGSTLPLDPAGTAKELGFDSSFLNSYDVAGDRDFVLELLQIGSQLMIHVSRLAEDFIYFGSSAVGWIELPDALCTGSSMMPQKKNPDVLELSRGKTASVLGHTQSVASLLKGLPTSYHRDLQQDKVHLFAVTDIVDSTLAVLPTVIQRFSIETARYQDLLDNAFLQATDLAEYLVRRGVPFRKAHENVGALVARCLDRGITLRDLTTQDLQEWNPVCDAQALQVLDPESTLHSRSYPGSAGLSSTREQIEYWRKRLG